MSTGTLVISLDFELQWGLQHDRALVESYRENLAGARAAVLAILELFQRYEVHATWATVGFLFFQSREELLRNLPANRPDYPDLAGAGEDEASDPLHFAPSLIRQIASTPHQEIGSHTFSHYHCFDSARDVAAFEADLGAAQNAARKLGLQLESLVFPRNVYDAEYIAIAAACGIRSYRGWARSWIGWARSNEDHLMHVRYLRRLDSYVNLTGHNCYRYQDLMESTPYNIPASRFLRPYSKRFEAIRPLELRRHQREMEHAARNNMVYHLWWHPENFGCDLARNLAFLEEILTHHRALGLQSMNMRELARELDRLKGGPNASSDRDTTPASAASLPRT
jgi:peptidoglycan/xylan/chitin deacetylase (PgdA/CDA1 family)